MKSFYKNIAAFFTINIVCCYLCGLAGLVRPFLLLFGLEYFGVIFIAVILGIYTVLPKQLKAKYSGSMLLFCMLILFCGILFVCGKYALETHYISTAAKGLRMAAKIMLTLLTLGLGCSLIRNFKSRVSIALTCCYIVLILVGMFIVPKHKHKTSTIDTATNSLKQIGSLGYLQWIPAGQDADKTSVVLHDANLALQGYNLYTQQTDGQAILIDMDGNEKFRWILDGKAQFGKAWLMAELCDNSDVIAYARERALVRVTPQNQIKWAIEGRLHHYFDIASDGTCRALVRKDAVVKMLKVVPVPMLDDVVISISKDGKLIDECSLTLPGRQLMPPNTTQKIYGHLISPKNLINTLKSAIFQKDIFKGSSVFDVLHINSVDLFENDIVPVAAKGNLLVSIRDINSIAVFDPPSNKYLWKWGPGQIIGQHSATILDNNNFLLLDNGVERKYSRIVEINPISGQIEWEYQAEPPGDFYTCRRGACSRLKNGNTLIVESEKGLTFEVTKDGQIVWKFYQPDLSKSGLTRMATRYVQRVDNGYDGVKNLQKSGYLE